MILGGGVRLGKILKWENEWRKFHQKRLFLDKTLNNFPAAYTFTGKRGWSKCQICNPVKLCRYFRPTPWQASVLRVALTLKIEAKTKFGNWGPRKKKPRELRGINRLTGLTTSITLTPDHTIQNKELGTRATACFKNGAFRRLPSTLTVCCVQSGQDSWSA